MLHAENDVVHVLRLSNGTLHHMVARRSPFDRRSQRTKSRRFRLFIQVLLGDDIGKGAVHGQEFRNILKAGKAALQLVVHTGGVQFPAVGNLPEAGGPGIEMVYLLFLQFLVLHIPLEGINLCDSVADGSAGHEIHAAPVMFPLEVATLDEKIESLG